jgi:hypothetical protein
MIDYSVKIICDSYNPDSMTRLTTFELMYPRYIHSELMTYRAFSRNASSSRAVPVAKLIDRIKKNPVVPVFTKNERGMTANNPVSQHIQTKAERCWEYAMNAAIRNAEQLANLGVAKQYVNRILEPYSYIAVILSGTYFSNFFEQRIHPDAQPEIRELATRMKAAYEESTPVIAAYGYIHLPYVLDVEREKYSLSECVKMSVARCARVSYLNHDGTTPVPERDFDLYERLVGSRPLHASPTEHIAIPVPAWHAGKVNEKNFEGWMQYRACVESRVGIIDGDSNLTRTSESLWESVLNDTNQNI